MAQSRAERTKRSIRNQFITAFALLFLGLGLMAIPLAALGEATIDADPAPLLPGIIVGSLGGALLLIARFRQLFFMPREVAQDVAQEGAKRILESLLG